MEQQNAYLDLTILSVADLKRNWLSGDQTVAVAWVDSLSKKSSGVASGRGSNVQWQNEKLTLSLNGADTLVQGKNLTIEIHSRGVLGNNLLGTVYVPLVDLALDGQKRANIMLTYQVVQPSGKRHGSLSFLAKIVKPRVSGSFVTLSSGPPSFPLANNRPGSGFNTLYPPAGAIYPSAEIVNEGPSFSYSPYPISEVSPYPPQSHLSQNHTPELDTWQNVLSPYPSHGMASHPPQLYPPVNMAPHSNYPGITPYPPLARQSSETPYPPPTSVYPPPASPFSEAPYPPTSFYPPIASHSSETPFPPASLYPYPSYPIPSIYPPPYPPQHPPVHCCNYYPTYYGASL